MVVVGLILGLLNFIVIAGTALSFWRLSLDALLRLSLYSVLLAGGIVLFRLVGAPIRWRIVIFVVAIFLLDALLEFSLFAKISASV